MRYTAHCPLPTTTVQQGTHSAVWCRAPSSAAPHRRHWWCSAARRVQWANETLCDCAQASARKFRPSARVHWSGYATTHLHIAHTTHTAQPVYLYPWVDIPAFCLLVTAPSAHHTTPHHTTPHHTTRHDTTPHRTYTDLVRPRQGACHTAEGPPGPGQHDGVGVAGATPAPASRKGRGAARAPGISAVARGELTRSPRLPLPLPRPTHLRTARTQHTQPRPFTFTRG